MMEKVAKPKAVKRPPTAPPPPPPGEGPSLRRRFIALDDQLASKGVKPLTKWWRDGIGAWLDRYEQHGVLEFWACVGRGAGKSVAMCKLAMFFTIEGSFRFQALPTGSNKAVLFSKWDQPNSRLAYELYVGGPSLEAGNTVFRISTDGTAGTINELVSWASSHSSLDSFSCYK